MRCLQCWKSIRGTISQCQNIKVKPAPKIHIIDFKKIEEEKNKKNKLSQVFAFKPE